MTSAKKTAKKTATKKTPTKAAAKQATRRAEKKRAEVAEVKKTNREAREQSERVAAKKSVVSKVAAPLKTAVKKTERVFGSIKEAMQARDGSEPTPKGLMNRIDGPGTSGAARKPAQPVEVPVEASSVTREGRSRVLPPVVGSSGSAALTGSGRAALVTDEEPTDEYEPEPDDPSKCHVCQDAAPVAGITLCEPCARRETLLDLLVVAASYDVLAESAVPSTVRFLARMRTEFVNQAYAIDPKMESEAWRDEEHGLDVKYLPTPATKASPLAEWWK